MSKEKTNAKGPAIGSAFKEEKLGQMSEREIMLRLWKYMRPYSKTFFICLLFLPLISGLSLIQPHLLQIAIDDYLVPGKSEGMTWIFVAFASAIVLQAGAYYLQIYLMQLAGQNALRDLRQDLFEHVQGRAIRFFNRHPIGRLMARMTTDIESLQEAVSSGLVTMIGDLFTLTLIVIILFSKSWKLTLISFAVVPFLIILASIFRYFLSKAFREIRVRIARLYSYLQESITGMSVIQLFVRESVSAKEYEDINASFRASNFDSIRYDALLYSVVEMVGSVTIGVIIWYGTGQVLQDAVTLGALVAFIEYMQKFFVPIRDLAQKYNLFLSAVASSERIFVLLDDDDSLENGDQEMPMAGESGYSLAFENVSFAYLSQEDEASEEDKDWIIRDLSFKVNPGEKIALVGHTGAGKTTLIRLALRLYDPTKGRITINGIDIKTLDINAYRKAFAVVLQDVFLFTGSVKENIRLWSPDISDAQVIASAKDVYAHRLIEGFSDGYDHKISERGKNLSAGERQLIAFARALAHTPEILILDEATANVDTETEALIQNAVEKMLTRQTSLVIAHRLSTIQNADRILVLHKGELLQEGPHEELVKQEGHYQMLYKLQYATQDT